MQTLTKCVCFPQVSSPLILHSDISQREQAGNTHQPSIYLEKEKKIPSVTYFAFLWAGGCQMGLTQCQPQTEESQRLCPSTHIYMHLCNSQETFHFNVWQGSVCSPHSYLESRSPDVRVTSPNLSPFSPSICQTLEE